MNGEIELKTCPFCGGKAEFVHDIYMSMFHVQCTNFSCIGHSVLSRRPSLREAAAAWNRRAK